MSETGTSETVLRLTAQIVSAHVEHNTVLADALPNLIEKVYQTLRDVGQSPIEPNKPVPAVPIKQSVKQDFIICLEDGKKLKTLKRHLAVSYNLTPAAYRQRWGLPNDYPMVAPAYAAQRSALAKSIGLGRKRAEPIAESKPEPVAEKPARRVTVGRKLPKTAA